MLADSGEFDKAPPDLGLHCLPMSHKMELNIYRVTVIFLDLSKICMTLQ